MCRDCYSPSMRYSEKNVSFPEVVEWVIGGAFISYGIVATGINHKFWKHIENNIQTIQHTKQIDFANVVDSKGESVVLLTDKTKAMINPLGESFPERFSRYFFKFQPDFMQTIASESRFNDFRFDYLGHLEEEKAQQLWANKPLRLWSNSVKVTYAYELPATVITKYVESKDHPRVKFFAGNDLSFLKKSVWERGRFPFAKTSLGIGSCVLLFSLIENWTMTLPSLNRRMVYQ